MFGSSSDNDHDNAKKAMWAGLDLVERLMVDKDYAKQVAQSSVVCDVCHDLDLEKYPLAVIRKVGGIQRREATIKDYNLGWEAKTIKSCGFCAMIADAIKNFFPDFFTGEAASLGFPRSP